MAGEYWELVRYVGTAQEAAHRPQPQSQKLSSLLLPHLRLRTTCSVQSRRHPPPSQYSTVQHASEGCWMCHACPTHDTMAVPTTAIVEQLWSEEAGGGWDASCCARPDAYTRHAVPGREPSIACRHAPPSSRPAAGSGPMQTAMSGRSAYCCAGDGDGVAALIRREHCALGAGVSDRPGNGPGCLHRSKRHAHRLAHQQAPPRAAFSLHAARHNRPGREPGRARPLGAAPRGCKRRPLTA